MIAPEVSTHQQLDTIVVPPAEKARIREIVSSPNFAQAMFELAERFEENTENALNATEDLLNQREE